MKNFIVNYKYILSIKLVLLALFTSKLTSTLYDIDTNIFPFEPFVTYLLSPFIFIVTTFSIENEYIRNIILKLPLFLFDIGIFILLLKVYTRDTKRVILFYFFNPVILYAVYVLASPEIVPAGLLFLAIFYLYIKKKIYKSAIIYGLTLSASLSFVIALPLLMLYLYKMCTSFKKLFIYLGIVLLSVVSVNFSYVLGESSLQMALLNQKQFSFFASYYMLGDLKVYVCIFIFSVIYYLFYKQRKVRYETFLFYMGMLFTAAIFLAYPRPEYYIWMIPYLSAFLIREKSIFSTSLVYMAFSLIYLVYFIFLFQHTDTVSNMLLSFLLGFNLIWIYLFYSVGIKSRSIYQREQNLIIGIGGDSGSGKSSLLRDIALLLNEKLLQLEGDGEHKWERGDANWESYTHLDPKANFIYKQASVISELKSNKIAYRSDYDHNTGKFTEPFKVEPKEFISISALHPFYLSYMRQRIDFKIYIDTDESLRRHWKILRDVSSRGYTIEKIMEQINARVSDTKKYIYPQKKFADFVIKYYPLETFTPGDKDAKFDLGLQLTFSANIQIEKLLYSLGSDVEWDYNDDLNTQHITIKHEPNIDFEKLATELIPDADNITAYEHEWLNGYKGLIQLFVVLNISEIMKGE